MGQRRHAISKIRSVLIARGAFGEVYEPSWHRALNDLGVQCFLFDSHSLTLPSLFGRIERRLLLGPGLMRIQRGLLSFVKRMRPDVTLLYQGHYFDKKTIDRIRDLTFVAGYHNDDPFGERQSMLRYRLLIPALPRYHGFHVYRPCNVQEAVRAGVPRVNVLMSYYLPWLDYPRNLPLTERKRWGCDVVFAGHFENDLRSECIVRAVQGGVDVRLYGAKNRWKRAIPKDILTKLGSVSLVFGEDYRKALCGAKIAAVFYSKWNRDEYTRRSFEIPACGVFMLSERTTTMKELFEEGKEAEYFSCPEEFVDKVRFYLRRTDARDRIATAGYHRVVGSGHDIHSRMRQWLEDISHWSQGRGINLVLDTFSRKADNHEKALF